MQRRDEGGVGEAAAQAPSRRLLAVLEALTTCSVTIVEDPPLPSAEHYSEDFLALVTSWSVVFLTCNALDKAEARCLSLPRPL